MRSFMLTLALALFTFSLSAQMTTKKADKVMGMVPEGNDTEEEAYTDYERIIESAFKVNFRSYAFNQMNLTSTQIEELTPLYLNYMSAKSDLMERRDELVNEFKDEMKEDDSLADENEETSDFIENYWEVDIAELELKKDYFDKFEDVLTYQKALQFFQLENQMRNRVENIRVAEVIPMLVVQPVYTYRFNPEVEKYNEWMMELDGTVDLSHEYTNQALTQLVNTAEALAAEADIEITNFASHKEKVMTLANDITKDWRSTDHADKVRKAFITVAAMYEDIAQSEPFATGSTSKITSELKTAAEKIEGKKLLTDQKEHVYNYFEKAQRTVNTLARAADTSWKTLQYESRK